jgi:RsmE family RNA methyltransferase
VSIHRQFKILLEDHLDALFAEGDRIVADPAAVTPLSTALQERSGSRLLLAIGPEGGWTEFELNLLAAHGFRLAGAGPRPLRSDTACIALLALAHDAMRRATERPGV